LGLGTNVQARPFQWTMPVEWPGPPSGIPTAQAFGYRRDRGGRPGGQQRHGGDGHETRSEFSDTHEAATFF
jgi:hypothetical protein